MHPIKIAVIDDGVTLSKLNNHEILKDGWPCLSTAEYGTSEPYYISGSGHGTMMARLVQMMCPFVNVYVTKVDIYNENSTSVAISVARVSCTCPMKIQLTSICSD